MSALRSDTPPPSAGLLTPPTTGGFGKSVRFADFNYEKRSNIGINAERSNKSKAGESPTSFFEKIQEGSSSELSDDSEGEDISSIDDTSPASPISTTSKIARHDVLEKQESFASLVIALVAPHVITGTFPFLKLPLSVRNQVYEHLLVVAAIICVRQNHNSFHEEEKAFLYAERRELLPGIACALAQITVNGFQTRFFRFRLTNIGILCVSKEIHTEAKAVLYGRNNFEIIKPTNEMCPPPDFSVRLFPSGCQRLVTKLNIRIRSFYDLFWLLGDGYNDIKNFYRGLDTLTLILEMDSASKGFGKRWARQVGEKWMAYITRLHHDLGRDLFGIGKSRNTTKVVPTWINLRVLFSGDRYDEKLNSRASGGSANLTTKEIAERAKRDELSHALVETWELFKKGGK